MDDFLSRIAAAETPKKAADLIYGFLRICYSDRSKTAQAGEFQHFFKRRQFETDPRFENFDMSKVLEEFTAEQIRQIGPVISKPLADYKAFFRNHGQHPWTAIGLDENFTRRQLLDKRKEATQFHPDRHETQTGSRMQRFNEAYELLKNDQSLEVIRRFLRKTALTAGSTQTSPDKKDTIDPASKKILDALKYLIVSENPSDRDLTALLCKSSRRMSTVVSGLRDKTMRDEHALEILKTLKDSKEYYAELNKMLAPFPPTRKAPAASASEASSSKDAASETHDDIYRLLALMVRKKLYDKLGAIREEPSVSEIIDRLEDEHTKSGIITLLERMRTLNPLLYRSLQRTCSEMHQESKASFAGFFTARDKLPYQKIIDRLYQALTSNPELQNTYQKHAVYKDYDHVFSTLEGREYTMDCKINTVQSFLVFSPYSLTRTENWEDLNNFLSRARSFMRQSLSGMGVDLSWNECCKEINKQPVKHPEDGLWQIVFVYGLTFPDPKPDLSETPSPRGNI